MFSLRFKKIGSFRLIRRFDLFGFVLGWIAVQYTRNILRITIQKIEEEKEREKKTRKKRILCGIIEVHTHSCVESSTVHREREKKTLYEC